MAPQKTIVILGYGEMGHAMEFLLGNKHQLHIWQRHDDSQHRRLPGLVANADMVLFCLPVLAHRELCQVIAPALNQNTICLSIAKGLDERGDAAFQIFNKELPGAQSKAYVYGPMISEEICRGRFAFADVACELESTFQDISAAFQHSQLITRWTSDIAGASYAVILKNVYAILFGIADQLQLGDNVRGFLASASLAELSAIVTQLHGQAQTPYHYAGLADLITTATSEDSHHHALGRALAMGNNPQLSGEGVHTLAMVQQFALFDAKQFLLFDLTAQLLQHPQQIRQKFESFIQHYQR